VTFTDPSPPPLLAVSDALERATDTYCAALDSEAEAQNEYLKLHSIAYLAAANEGVAATMRDKHAQAQPAVVTARCAWNLAEAASKRCRAKVSELESRLMAHQSALKYYGANDGGIR